MMAEKVKIARSAICSPSIRSTSDWVRRLFSAYYPLLLFSYYFAICCLLLNMHYLYLFFFVVTGTVRSLVSFWAQLAQLGVSRPVPGANAHGTSQSGCVVRDDTKRLAFLKTGAAQGMLPFRFAQASAASTAPPPEGLSTALSGAEQLPQSDARLMALLSSTAGLGSRIQRFL